MRKRWAGIGSKLARREFLGAMAWGSVGASVLGGSRRAWAHPEPVSFTEMHHRPAKSCVECSLRCKVEDLEHVTQVMSGLTLRFGGKGFEAWIVAYLRRVFVLRGPKGQTLDPLTYVGQEEDGPFVWLYLRLPTVHKNGPELSQHLSGYYLSQGYMLSVVPYQVNTVVLHRGQTKQTLHYQEDAPRFLTLPPVRS